MTGFAHANDISEAAIRRAAETLTLLDPTKTQPAPSPKRTNRHLYTEANPLELVPFAKKVALCEQIDAAARSEEHTSELQSLMRISSAVFCLKKKTKHTHNSKP